jgi:hypothetical protein
MRLSHTRLCFYNCNLNRLRQFLLLGRCFGTAVGFFVRVGKNFSCSLLLQSPLYFLFDKISGLWRWLRPTSGVLTLWNVPRCHICPKAPCAVWTLPHLNRVYVLWDLAQRWINWICFWYSFWDLGKLYNPDRYIVQPVCRSLPRSCCFFWLWSIQALATGREQRRAWLYRCLQGFLRPLFFLSISFLDPLEVATFLI